ncbi:MAG: hypothetical protein U5K74_12620 [Gemmatimonadaceae bacterium]|nr:hypothetical protein [Gemmatimonadaceae bacterium]
MRPNEHELDTMELHGAEEITEVVGQLQCGSCHALLRVGHTDRDFWGSSSSGTASNRVRGRDRVCQLGHSRQIVDLVDRIDRRQRHIVVISEVDLAPGPRLPSKLGTGDARRMD